MDDETYLREMAVSLASDLLTNVPFQMGDLQIEKVGFADIPMVFVIMACPSSAISVMVAIVRQFVFRELEAAGITNEALEFKPTIERLRRRQFIDCNERSATKGKNKIGRVHRVAFTIRPQFVGYFEWGGSCKKVGRIPERHATR